MQLSPARKAASFGLSGLIKKQLRAHGSSIVAHDAGWRVVLPVLAGAVTAVPLLLFAGAANRSPLSAIGLLPSLAPFLQLSVFVFVFDEPMPATRRAGFGPGVVVLAGFTWDGVRQQRSRTRTRRTGDAPTRPTAPVAEAPA